MVAVFRAKHCEAGPLTPASAETGLEIRPYYPAAGPWAVAARAAFMMAVAAVMFASLAPLGLVPRFLNSPHLEHFAAFYVTTLATAAAWPRVSVMRMGVLLGLFAGVLELARMIPAQHRIYGALDWEADFGGILAALAPIVVALFRLRFEPPKAD